MPTLDQVEIVSPTGEVVFYNLDPAKGVTNIGRHPENDVVIDSPGVALFHAVLDHRQKPFRIVVLSEEGETTLHGERLLPNISAALQAWDPVELDGHTMLLVGGTEIAAQPASPVLVPTPEPISPPQPAPVPTPGAQAEAPVTPMPSGLAARPPDLYDQVILTELSEREWNIDVEQTVFCEVTITNGGSIVAAFGVQVTGIDPSWVTVSHPQINLVEGESVVVAVSITPPRESSSRSGAHHFGIVVTSPNHPGRQSQKGATLHINPFYEFSLGELSPKQQTISWRQRSGQVVLPIANKGNSVALFRIEAQDDERGCSFEFQVPGEATSLARQAEMRLPPEQTFAIPITITPHSRRLIGLRKRAYSFSINSSMPEGLQTPRSVMGRLGSKPLIGPGLIALTLLFMAVACVVVFHPGIYQFEGDLNQIKVGTPVALSWQARHFSSLKIEPEIGGVESPEGTKVVYPNSDTTYVLKAENFLSQLIPPLAGQEEVFGVEVEPVEPKIAVFRVSRNSIVRGETTMLIWEVADADELTIVVDPPADFGDSIVLGSELKGQYQVIPEQSTSFTLVANNTKSNTQADSRAQVEVLEPTGTPVPPPVIDYFEVKPERIVLGEEVLFNWSVSGDPETVDISGIGQVEAVGPLPYIPKEEGTLSFWLMAYKAGVLDPVKQLRKVVVDPAPTGTPEPNPPEIEDFRIKPEEVILGDGESIQLFWLVSGDVTDIQISGPSFGPVNNLAKEGSLPVTADETTFFMLTVFGVTEDQIASETVELTVLEPTPIPPPTPTPIPTPNIAYFRVENAEDFPQPGDIEFQAASEPPTYMVVAGTLVRLTWLVQDAIKVTLEGFGDQPAEGRTDPLRVYSDQAKQYSLVAENSAGDTAEAILAIKLKVLEPPPPFDLSVQHSPAITLSGVVTLKWNYPLESVDEITGFRIYRNPALVQDLPDPALRDWIDATDTIPICGRAYYVVALYIDEFGGTEQTAQSNDVFIAACPTPTPGP